MSKNKPRPQKPKHEAKPGAPKKERKTPEPRLIKPQAERSLNGFTRALNSIEESFAGLLGEGVMAGLRATRESLAAIAAGIDPTLRRSRGERPAIEFANGAEVHFTKAAVKSMKGLLDGTAAFKGYVPNTKSAMAAVAVTKPDGSVLDVAVPTAYIRKRPELS